MIHILNRSRFRTVEWGAMHLLDSVIKVNHKKFRVDQLILLLIRCAIPVLLALCLARPVLTGSQSLIGNRPISLVIVLDTSYSMATESLGKTRISEAISAAKDFVNAAPRGSDVSVILTGGKATHLLDEPVFDSHLVVSRLEQIDAGYGANDISGALDEALETLARMSQIDRRLIVISDFQEQDWDTNREAMIESLQQQLALVELPPALSFFPIGSTEQENVAVENIRYSQRTLGVGQRLDVRATLHNYGQTDLPNVRVALNIDGQEESVTQLNLTAGGSTQTLFPVSFSTAGSHLVEVAIVAEDSLPNDNRRSAAITVWDEIRVLLVDGDPSSQPLEGETDFLSVALTPFSFGRVRLADLIKTESIRVNELTSEKLTPSQVVVLANVPKLSDKQLQQLTDYVQQGGSLFIFPGNKIDLSWYREKFYDDGKGLLPLAYLSLEGDDGQAGLTSRLISQHFTHPALSFFNDTQNGDLTTAEIRRWYDMGVLTSPEENSSAANTQLSANVIARIATGQPFLAERISGRGIVLQSASACDADWSDFPMKPVYVPFMQQLVTYLAARLTPPQNIETGEPITAILSETQSGSTLTINTPNGDRQGLTARGDKGEVRIQYERTQRPGVYTLTLPEGTSRHFVAETSRRESAPLLLSRQSLKNIAESVDAVMIESMTDYLKQDDLRRHGQEIWKAALGIFLAFLFLEVVLQQRFAGVGS